MPDFTGSRRRFVSSEHRWYNDNPNIPAKGELVAQYSLTLNDTMLNGRADEAVWEIQAHLDRGDIVEESFDNKRQLWTYRVFKPREP